jgi:hypothetical protein
LRSGSGRRCRLIDGGAGACAWKSDNAANVSSGTTSIDDMSVKERNMSTLGVKTTRSRVTTPLVLIGCVVINLFPMATVAAAHVKWFVTCDSSDSPIPLQAVFTTTFWLFAALFVLLFYLACKLEQTAIGAFLARLLDRATKSLHERADVLLRAVAAVSFSLLWADGGVILTPELKGNSAWLSAIQVLVPIYLIGRALLPAAAAGIVVLYGYGIATYGLFHMLDYPVFLGLAVYFALSASRNANVHAFRFDCLRWSVALSLLWPAMEKFLYPAWVAPIAATHPELTLGFDVATVITAAGVVEFGLAFALFWTPLVRRLGALTLTLVLFAATFDFGKMDGIGHLMIIAILLVVVAEPGREQVRCRPALAPVVSGAALLAAIFLYSGAHALYYDSLRSALAPFASGMALLAVIFLVLNGFAPALLRMRPQPSRPGPNDPRHATGNVLVMNAHRGVRHA